MHVISEFISLQENLDIQRFRKQIFLPLDLLWENNIWQMKARSDNDYYIVGRQTGKSELVVLS
jgi:hypothetical protein